MRNIYVNDIEFINSITNIKIDTPDGIQDIGDTIVKDEKCSILITDNTRIEVANNHMFLDSNDNWLKLEELSVGDKLKSKSGTDTIEFIEETGIKKVYDFEVLHENHRYYSNNLISHNTGKTVLALMGALTNTAESGRHNVFDEIIVTKPPVSINRDMYTGFKPGTSEEKMGGHLGGIKSNLKFLLDPKRDSRKKKLKPGEEPEETNSERVWREKFGIIEIDEIQGTSLHDTCLIVDEYQLLDTDTLKLVLSRISENSKVILVGDTDGQTYGMNRGNEGFKVLYKHLGNSEQMSYVKLKNIYRSKLASFVQEIFKD